MVYSLMVCFYYDGHSLQEVDAALLGIVGFPAFAVDDEALIDHTVETILDKLKVNVHHTLPYHQLIIVWESSLIFRKFSIPGHATQ